jgi:hypothetical protein
MTKCRDHFHFWTWDLQMTRPLFRNKQKKNMKFISVAFYNGILPGDRISWYLYWVFSAYVAAETWSYEPRPHPSTSFQNTAFSNNIKMDLTYTNSKYMGWIHLPVDSVEVRALVNTKLCFLFHEKWGFSWIAEPLLASEEKFSPMQIVLKLLYCYYSVFHNVYFFV